MKNTLLVFTILLSQLTTSTAQNKNFIGRILYKNAFTTPTGVDLTAQLSGVMGAEQDYYINENNYKSVLNGSAITMQLFNGATNKYYMILPNKTAQEIDATIVSDSVLSVEHIKAADTLILGRKCPSVVIKTAESLTIYFYDPTLKVDKVPFNKHEFGNWNRYLQESNGALPIKYISQSKMFTWTAEAIKIEEKALTDKDFELGNDIKIKK